MRVMWEGLFPLMDSPERTGGGAADGAADGEGHVDVGTDDDADGGDDDSSGPDIEILPDDEATPRTAAADASDDDDEDDDEDDGVDETTLTEREKRWRNKERRQRAKAAKLRRSAGPLLDTVRSLARDGEDPVRTLTRLLQRAQQADTLEEAIQAADPRIRELLQGRAGSGERGGSPPADDDFDASSLPFDPATDDVTRWMGEQARRTHALQRTVQQLQETLTRERESAEQRSQREVETRELRTWEAAATAAAKGLPERIRVGTVTVNLRKTFIDNVYGAFRYARANGLKVSPEKVIRHYLAESGLDEKEQARARAAARQRIARDNTKLPQHQAGGGKPAPARTGRENLASVLKRTLGVATVR